MNSDKGNNYSNILKSSPVDCNSAFSVNRIEASYTNLSDRFICNNRDFNRQYLQLYLSRLSSMQDAVKKSCIAKWGDNIPIRKLHELALLKREKCIIIGTIFKRQELKPSVLKEIEEQHHINPQPKPTNFVSVDDELILEDEFQRIRLLGNIEACKFVNGIVMGVIGFDNKDETFDVLDYTFAELTINIDRKIDYVDDRLILLVSGLNFGVGENLLLTQLLIDWINGELGCPKDQENQSKICRVIIAGNAIKSAFKVSVITDTSDQNSHTVSSVKLLDKLLLDLVKNVDVDIMPGDFDPANCLLPQQPINRCIYLKCSEYDTLHRVTNPYECIIEGRRILGSSGQPVNDIKSLTDITDNLTALESTLSWGHVIPTAPDTLDCYPYYHQDPFSIIEQPDIYFAGNVSSFGTKLIHLNGRPVRLVCLPVFAETQTCGLVNLRTLECRPLHFKVF